MHDPPAAQSILRCVDSNQTSVKRGNEEQGSLPASPDLPGKSHNLFYQRVVLPIVALLRRGASPKRLAWSIAVGLLIGVNPALGTTTILCLAVAMLFRLNIAASQLANHVIYPVQLLLLVPFLQLGSFLFHTEPVPFSTRTLLAAAKENPVGFIRQISRWEWHAFLVWATLAVVLVPVIGLALTPLLRRLSVRLQRRDSASSADTT